MQTPPPPPIPPPPPVVFHNPNRDNEHVKLLVVFHYVLAGLLLLGILFLGLHYFALNTIFLTEDIWESAEGTPPPKGFFTFFIWFYILMGCFLIVQAAANILSAIFMQQRRYRMFSIVIAAINCLNIPFGTLLGVFTIVTLIRESVISSYSESEKV